MRLRRPLAVAVLGLLIVTCKKDSSAPPPTPAAIVKIAGDAQTGPAGVALAMPLVVQINDAQGSPLNGITVTFTITQGGGSTTTGTQATGVNGRIAGESWTIGTVAGGAQQVTVSVAGGSATPVTFTATAVAGPAANVIVQAGNAQSATTGAAVAVAPSVRVRDQFNNPVAGAEVTFAVTGGGGNLAAPVDTSPATGIATVGSWTLGSAGANTMTATVTGAGITGNPVQFTATAIAATVAVNAGNNQTGLVGFAVNVPPSVVVLDNLSAPVVGATVTFAPASGGGSVTGGSTTTNGLGIATVGRWVLGAGPGANTLTATVTGSGIGNNPATFSATGQAAAYNITLQYLVPVSPSVEAAFDSARARWQRVIYGDLPDVQLSLAAGACGINSPTLSNQTIDDILIFVTIDSIDGPNKILGQAGPCNPVRGGSLLIVVGRMLFDSADVATFLGQGQFDEIVLHEMGHVLGFGTLWSAKGLLVDPSLGGGTDPHFIGAQSIAAFDRSGGAGYNAGARTPVENTCPPTVSPPCPGTQDGHWRESVFDTELMTGLLDGGVANPFSVITAGSMQDLGYIVNYAASDPYVVANPLAALGSARLEGVQFMNDAISLPYFVTVDRLGRVTGIVNPR